MRHEHELVHGILRNRLFPRRYNPAAVQFLPPPFLFFLLPFANLLLCQPEIVCPELFVSDLLWKYELHVTCRETVITLFHEVT